MPKMRTTKLTAAKRESSAGSSGGMSAGQYSVQVLKKVRKTPSMLDYPRGLKAAHFVENFRGCKFLSAISLHPFLRYLSLPGCNEILKPYSIPSLIKYVDIPFVSKKYHSCSMSAIFKY